MNQHRHLIKYLARYNLYMLYIHIIYIFSANKRDSDSMLIREMQHHTTAGNRAPNHVPTLATSLVEALPANIMNMK